MEAQVPSDQWPLVRQVYLDLVLAKMWKTIQIKPGELTFIEAVEPGSPVWHRNAKLEQEKRIDVRSIIGGRSTDYPSYQWAQAALCGNVRSILSALPKKLVWLLLVSSISDTFAKLEKARGSDDLRYQLSCSTGIKVVYLLIAIIIRKITFAIVSSDSTIVYYHIHKGLVPPSQR